MNVNISKIGARAGWAAAIFLSLFAKEAQAAESANYDTSWTYVYHGGKTTNGTIINDVFRDVKTLPSGETICVGGTRDSALMQNILLIRLDRSGKPVRKSLLSFNQGVGGSSVLITANGDFVVGGERSGAPLLVRLDTSFAIKYSTWYYDSVSRKDILARGATINSLVETDGGRIFAAAGDIFPNNDGLPLNNYAALLEFDHFGKVKPHIDWLNTTGYELAGWSLAPAENGGFMLGGKQSVFKIDTTGVLRVKSNYSFSLPGVGTELNNVSRVRRMRSGMVMVAGQSYEEDCWTKYQRLYYDAWWSPLSPDGNDDYRFTAGISGANDIVYDFTQLVDGRIVFIGKKQSPDQYGGIWAIVTDSIGKNIQWEKQIRIPYQKSNGSALIPWSVAASPDSGFTVVGVYGLPDTSEGDNAFAAHFVPKPIPASILANPTRVIHASLAYKAGIFSFYSHNSGEAHIDLFNLQGSKVFQVDRHLDQAGKSEIRIDASLPKPGTYVWQLRIGKEISRGFLPIMD